MPNDLSISAVGPAVALGGRTSHAVPPARATPVAQRVLPNPSLRLEAALGLVVIEFRNASGAIETSYPTERQLAAYRTSELTGEPVPGTGNRTVPAGTPTEAPATGHAPTAARGEHTTRSA